MNRPAGMGGVPRGPSRFMGPKVRPQNTRETLSRLWAYFGSEKKRLIWVLFIVLLNALLLLLVPFFIGRAIDALTFQNGNVDFGMLFRIIVILLSVYIMDGLLNLTQGFTVAGVSQRMVQKLRAELFVKLQRLPIAFFDTQPHGEIMSRLTNDIDNVSTTISQSTTTLISGVFTLTGALVMMLILSPLLTLASLVTVPLVYLLTRFVAKNTSKLFREQQKTLGFLNGQIEESISGIEVVRAFNHEKKIIDDFEIANEELRKIGLKAQIYSGFLMPLMNVINNFGFTVVASLGGYLATQNVITVGIIASFLTYSRQFSRPLNDMANIFNTLQSAMAGAERVFQVLDEGEETDDLSTAEQAGNFIGEVKFEQVAFGYEKDRAILKNVNFKAKPGMTIALVGPTGAGKTTIVNLLTRFYDVTSGRILIDGTDIRDYSRTSLRQNFGMVLQDTYLFAGTIRENIKYGRLGASDEEVVAAAKMANSHAFIKRLPKGYDTVLVEGGSNISQGQRQLLAITRAVLANPSILILDEATSSIDTRTESRIQKALLKLMHGRTSFVIAHRLSTIREADIIIVVDNGQVREMGSHEELVQQKGFYYEMLESQVGALRNV